MRILKVSAVAALLTMTLAAHGQNSTQSNPNVPGAQGEPSGSQQAQPQDQAVPNRPIGKEVKQKLEEAGFSEIAVLPNSFVVRAKNQQGEPVIMLVDSDAMIAIELNSHGEDTTTGESPSSPGSSPSRSGEHM